MARICVYCRRMILDFDVNQDTYTEYCLNCHQAATFSTQVEDGKKQFICDLCNAENGRKLIIDLKLKWWLDEENHYCHESVGSILVNQKNEILFFELTKPPYGLTFPAGHVDVGESPLSALKRETKEEAGIDLDRYEPKLVGEMMVAGDSCRRGSDDHQWSLFVTKISDVDGEKVELDDHEGTQARWMVLSDVDRSNLAPAIQVLFNNFGSAIFTT